MRRPYKVRYASNNPHTMDQRQPYMCADAEHLEAFLHHWWHRPWLIHQACAELVNARQGGLSVRNAALVAAAGAASFPASYFVVHFVMSDQGASAPMDE